MVKSNIYLCDVHFIYPPCCLVVIYRSLSIILGSEQMFIIHTEHIINHWLSVSCSNSLIDVILHAVMMTGQVRGLEEAFIVFKMVATHVSLLLTVRGTALRKASHTVKSDHMRTDKACYGKILLFVYFILILSRRRYTLINTRNFVCFFLFQHSHLSYSPGHFNSCIVATWMTQMT